MRVHLAVAMAILLTGLGGCATKYQEQGFTGGFAEREVREGVWLLAYGGNGFTNYETVQTYWLYRAAELTVDKGYDGFEIVSDMQLSALAPRAGFIPAQIYTNRDAKPHLMGEIRMLRKPLDARPPKTFDAAALKAALEPRVKGELCGGNVCPHLHDYLMPPLHS